MPDRSSYAARAKPIAAALVITTAALVAGWYAGNDPIEQARFGARWTARASFLFFLIVYCARPLTQLVPAPAIKAVLRNRRHWGLAFALAHTIHLGALIHYLDISGEQRPLPVLLGGGFGYVLLYAMALTSNDASQRAMGIWWKRLHRIGIHYIWLVFLLSYAGRIADPARAHIGLTFTPLVLAALALRVTAWVSRRGRIRTQERI